MTAVPVQLGALDAIPPALRYRIKDALARLPGDGEPLDGVTFDRIARLIDDGEPWLPADGSLADVGAWMIERDRAPQLRRLGCVWLGLFPTVQTVRRLAAIALDDKSPPPVREAAIAALGDRAIRARHPALRWPADAIQLADETLVQLANAATDAGKVASAALPLALRHVQWEGAAAAFARAPGLWGDAIEAFATPALARVLLVCFEDVAAPHRQRVVRLVGAVLGEEALPLLAARASQAAPADRLECLLASVTIAGEPALGALEDALRGSKQVELVRERAKWHLGHRGVFPTVRGLRTARATAVIAPEARAAACTAAADDLGALTKFARHAENYLYTQWGWMVRGASDAVRARELVAAHPESQALVRELHLADLAKRGRVTQLAAAAQTLGAPDVGALLLATWGRPLAALELAAAARTHTAELAVARVLACYRAGRPDLAVRLLAEDPPPSEIVDDVGLTTFPGPHERWLVARAPAARSAVGALAAGRDAVLALAQPAPIDAEPDSSSIASIAAVARRLGRSLAGATVYLAGEFKYLDKAKIAHAVEAAGARLVGGPFPGTDFYVHGDWCAVHTIAQLERQGARRLRSGELEGI